MKCMDGTRAIDLLSRSTRVREDLTKILCFGLIEDFECQLVIREWIDEVVDRPEYEFRGFVSEKKLNALSMYYCLAHSEELVQRKEEVQNIILDFFEKIKHRIPHSSYVIDFYIKANTSVLIIELNPFHIGAGPCLFSWKENREQFLHGPFEFRIIEEIPKDFQIIPIRWKKYIDYRYVKQPRNTRKSKELGFPFVLTVVIVGLALGNIWFNMDHKIKITN
eukprot:TRINITY_DN1680_c0_g1_i1.p1 TRINITY_DN1680_c0_g1~~TRINITY_DN1680_c0_g1_i1.p1  ORF type:complete len:221 (-),score=33.82 TRINITY_DN1680_c0_g1_i1:49-711(-)